MAPVASGPLGSDRGIPPSIGPSEAAYCFANAAIQTAGCGAGDRVNCDGTVVRGNRTRPVAGPMQRIAEPIEIVGPVLYLASEASSFVTGDDISVSGGMQK